MLALSMYNSHMTALVLGPVLRYVGEDSVTVWVETAQPCEVSILGRTARTFTAHGHHYALVIIDGLEPGTRQTYEVHLDGEQVWPLPNSGYPPSVVRTLAPGQPLKLIFGSCRHATPASIGADSGYAPDALDTYAVRMAGQPIDEWPDLLMLLGDQVYADDTSPDTQRLIASRRSLDDPPGTEVADFEEYTALYRESWTDPDVRWLMSTVATAMIFDDHDVRDDWNTSVAWRRQMRTTSWWQERITAGLASYWIYQHIGNMSPAELAADPYFQRIHAMPDAAPVLDEMARVADREADSDDHDGDPIRWSYRRDLGRTRLIVLDTRCGRVLTDTRREMMSDADFDWFTDQLRGDYDHLLIGSSLPWLMPQAIHHLETWSEALCAGAHGGRIARWAEKGRQASDLEHWPAFHGSFLRLTDLLAGVAAGDLTDRPPASISVLSGDVHHAYVAKAIFDRPTVSPVYQLTCSPVHNSVPDAMRIAFSTAWNRWAASLVKPLSRLAKVGRSPVRWKRLTGPHFGNELATLELTGRSARVQLERVDVGSDSPRLVIAAQTPLAWRNYRSASTVSSTTS